MGATDWTELSLDLNSATVDRGVTAGVARPSGGGNFVYGFNSLVVPAGAVGFFCNGSGFAPSPALKGGSIRGAVQRGISAGPTNFSPQLFICLQGTTVNDVGYMLGLQDLNPYRIALVKGSVVNGVPGASIGSSGVLRQSTQTFNPGMWHHLRMDAVVNANGDVVLKAFFSDLTVNTVTAPVWQTIPGIEDTTLDTTFGAGTAFIDDALAINSGSQPYTTGRMGYSFSVRDVSRRAFFDQIECQVQL